MGLSDVIIGGIVMVLIVSVVVALMTLILPMYVKTEFDSICRRYALVIEAENGLSYENRQQLIQELKRIGVHNILVTSESENSVKRHEAMTFQVEGVYYGIQTEVPFMFQTKVLARKVFN